MKVFGSKIDRKSKFSSLLINFMLFTLLIISSLFATDNPSNSDIVDSLTRQFEDNSTFRGEFNNSSKLENYLAYAAINSPVLRSAFYHWKASLEKAGYAGALPDPVFSYKYFIENVETRVGPQNQKFAIKQSFPWFGTLGAKKNIAQQKAKSEYHKFQAEKLKLYYSVKSAYYNFYFLSREISITKDNLELLKFWESVLQTKYKVALKQQPELIKVQVELAKLEDELITLQNKIIPYETKLRSIINLPDSIDISVSDMIYVNETAINSDSITSKTLNNNPNLKAIKQLVEREKIGIQLAKKATMPNFTFSVEYIETGSALNPELIESGKDPWIVGASINLPIWFGKNKAGKNAAKAKLQTAIYNYSDAQNNLKAYISNLIFEYNDALRKLHLYRDGLILKAEQALNVSYISYQAGESDFLNVLDAQRELLSMQLNLEKAITNLATYQAEIEMIIGEEIEY